MTCGTYLSISDILCEGSDLVVELSWCVVFVLSPFIRALFPENLEAEKRGRPSTASSKIKVRECDRTELISQVGTNTRQR